MDVFHEVKSIVAKYGHVDPDDITLDSTVDSLGLDSLSVIDIGVGIEEHSGRQVDQEQIDSFTSIRDMVDFMEQDS
ncbi:acyl carrier protein [Corynebacterium sp. MC-04]|uniref:Phosphopantetheine-binding protein n=2 Tax=Corynebacterium TaxID=1716 RepID=A0AAU0Q450_9CORY|nr:MULTISPECIES: phosphopantetheine-binding protein [Corynebacterium]KXB50449.1 putative acyl carrier protein [Corynebacterium kroppenstedtii]MCZ9303309.1 acyl carrier protein [Corynebacterium sp. c24U_166]MBY0789094.1 acyl carrier protein [Corynebacterium parakroppenstedtii]MBY0790865.1 acyl carrier protein [Corynebacterium pseudokroppenstedtii]MBY0793157.1 acyl carrier protein [Corynebacterium parakroppenstedtii]